MNESDPYLFKKFEIFEIGSVKKKLELEKVGEISKILMILVRFSFVFPLVKSLDFA